MDTTAPHHVFHPAERPGHPLLLLLHGPDGDEEELVAAGRGLLPESALLAPRGFGVHDGMDGREVEERVVRLERFVDKATIHYGLDPDGVIAVGRSDGASLAAASLLLHPGLLRAAVMFAPAPVLHDPPRPDLTGRSAFIAAGRADRVTDPLQSERLAADLRRCGADVVLHWHPGEGDAVSGPALDAAQAWLRVRDTAL
ncbi:alpha/beta hydrolase [Marinactinospora endophytica]